MNINAKIEYPGDLWSGYTRTAVRGSGIMYGVWERDYALAKMYGRCYISLQHPPMDLQSEEPFEVLVRVMEVFAEIRIQ